MNGWCLPGGDSEYWTQGHTARMVIQLNNTSIDHTVRIEAIPWLGYGALDKQRVNVSVNGNRIGEWIFNKTGIQENKMNIPHKDLKE